MVTTDDLDTAHLRSFRNRPLVGQCGCFFCLAEFDASVVTTWVDDGRTALCPKCGIDSVLSEPDNDPARDAASVLQSGVLATVRK